MPLARDSIGFSSEPRICRPIEVRARNAQVPAITTIVVTTMTARQIEKSMPNRVKAPGRGSLTDL